MTWAIRGTWATSVARGCVFIRDLGYAYGLGMRRRAWPGPGAVCGDVCDLEDM
jgi:hypothetical protein